MTPNRLATKESTKAETAEEKPPKWKKVGKWTWKFVVFVGLPGAVLLPVSAYMSEGAAKLYSKQHVMKTLQLEWQPPDQVSCTVWSMAFIPKQSITHFDMFFHFAQEYHDVLVRKVRPNLTGVVPRQVPEDIKFKDGGTCVVDEPSMPNSEHFSVIRYNNGTDITVRASDLTPDDSYNVMVIFHPDFMIGSTGWHGHANTLTYTVFGHELTGTLDPHSPPPSFNEDQDSDMPPIPSDFDKQK